MRRALGEEGRGARTIRPMAALLAVAPLLGGCGLTGDTTPAAPCPRIALLAEGADLTRFRAGGGQDLTALEVDARIAGYNASCDYARRGGAIDVTVTVGMDAERGPAATSRTVELPWFVAVTDAAGDRVLDRQGYVLTAGFPANVSRASVTTAPVRLQLPVGRIAPADGAGGDGAIRRVDDYVIHIAFQLSPEELELNRRRGVR